jgi:hypothetical protein
MIRHCQSQGAGPVFPLPIWLIATRLLAGSPLFLGKAELAEHYAKLADAVRQVFQQEFVSPEGRVLATHRPGWRWRCNSICCLNLFAR